MGDSLTARIEASGLGFARVARLTNIDARRFYLNRVLTPAETAAVEEVLAAAKRGEVPGRRVATPV